MTKFKATVKKSATSTKNFARNHRVAIAIVGTSAVWAALMIRNAKELDEFLKEHGLYDEYHYSDLLDPIES